MFSACYAETLFLPTLQKYPELKAKVAQLPLWREKSLLEVLYMNESMLQALRAADVTGLEPYSDYYGKSGEAVGRFE